MYSAFVLIPQFVQVPESTGFGFGASVTQAGLFLVPSTIAMLFVGPIAGRLSNTVGSKVPLVLGSIVTALSFVVLVVVELAAGRSTSPPCCSASASAWRSPRWRT